jgi:DNA-directed RNA polymerase subunit RPC12/RpoP
MMSTNTSNDRLYSCRHCGAEYKAYPPDDVHSECDVNQITDSIEIPYKCTNCNQGNKLYWGRPMNIRQ